MRRYAELSFVALMASSSQHAECALKCAPSILCLVWLAAIGARKCFALLPQLLGWPAHKCVVPPEHTTKLCMVSPCLHTIHDTREQHSHQRQNATCTRSPSILILSQSPQWWLQESRNTACCLRFSKLLVMSAVRFAPNLLTGPGALDMSTLP